MIGTLHVGQEVAPEVNTTFEVVILFFDPGFSGALPQIFLTALENPTTVEIRSGRTSQFESFANLQTENFTNLGEQRMVPIPIGADLLDSGTIVRVTRGRIALSAISPRPFQMHFRRPETIRA